MSRPTLLGRRVAFALALVGVVAWVWGAIRLARLVAGEP